jgi:hypothetical protein
MPNQDAITAEKAENAELRGAGTVLPRFSRFPRFIYFLRLAQEWVRTNPFLI